VIWAALDTLTPISTSVNSKVQFLRLSPKVSFERVYRERTTLRGATRAPTRLWRALAQRACRDGYSEQIGDSRLADGIDDR
jgi:hypothetical protein